MIQHDWTSDVIGFWFDILKPKDWWSAEPGVDAAVRTRFAALRDALIDDPPEPAGLDAEGHLAAVLVYDQFPRNLFRGSPEAFATDDLALSMTIHAIDCALDVTLTGARRQFLYMPLVHSEDSAMQALSLARFEDLGDAGSLRSARSHQATIARFGRFPHRNAVLGRKSTNAEVVYLANGTR